MMGMSSTTAPSDGVLVVARVAAAVPARNFLRSHVIGKPSRLLLQTVGNTLLPVNAIWAMCLSDIERARLHIQKDRFDFRHKPVHVEQMSGLAPLRQFAAQIR